MERIEKIMDFAKETLTIVKGLSSEEIKEHPAFKVVSEFIPCAKSIIEIGSWWSAYREKQAIPQKAIVMVCHEVGITDTDCERIQSPGQLEAQLRERGISNPGTLFEHAVNRLFSEAKFPELTRFLVDQQATVLSELERQFESLKLSLQAGFHHLLPLERVLEVLPVANKTREPRFFRRIGPLAVDFDAGRVYRRAEVDQVKQILAEKRKLLLMGTAASGKSVVARQAAYELWRAGSTVYWLSLTQGIERTAIQGELERLGNGNNLVVIEDLHLAPKEINHLLAFPQAGWPMLLLTSRPIDFKSPVFDKAPNYLEPLPQVVLQPFDAAQAIIELFCNQHGIETTPALIKQVTDASRDSLWLLAYALVALKNSGWAAVDQAFILTQVEQDLQKIWNDNDRDDRYPKLLVALSVLYRYEIPTDVRFLKDVFPGSMKVLADLTDLGEVVQKGTLFYGLPHSALAGFYHECRMHTTWDDELYRDTGAFLRRYVLSNYAENASSVLISLSLQSTLVQAVQLEDMATFASRIESDENLGYAIIAIDRIQKADPAKGQALVAALDLNCMARRIEADEYLVHASQAIENILKADPAKGQALVAALDLNCMARRIEASEYLGDAARAIENIQKADLANGQALVAALDLNRMARRIEAADLRSAAWAIKIIQLTDPAKGQALVAALDLNRMARRIEASEYLWEAVDAIEIILKTDPAKGQALIAELDLNRIARRIESVDLGGSARTIEMIQKIDPSKGQALVAALDLSRLARHLETSMYLNTVADVIETIQLTDQAIGNTLIQILSRSPNNAELLEKLGETMGD